MSKIHRTTIPGFKIDQKWMNADLPSKNLEVFVQFIDCGTYFPTFCIDYEGCQYWDVPARALGIREYHGRKDGVWDGVKGNFADECPEIFEHNERCAVWVDGKPHVGRSHYGFMWRKSDVLLYLIEMQHGGFLLWPVHKIRFELSGEPLPDWKRNRHEP